MKNDKLIEEKVTEIKNKALEFCWTKDGFGKQNTNTDKILKEIIFMSKELEELMNTNISE